MHAVYLLIENRGVGSFVLINNSDHQCDQLWPEVQVLGGGSLVLPRDILLLTLFTRQATGKREVKGRAAVACTVLSTRDQRSNSENVRRSQGD